MIVFENDTFLKGKNLSGSDFSDAAAGSAKGFTAA